MLCQPGDVVRFLSFFQDSTTGLGVTGLTVAVNVNRGTTNAVSAGSATVLDATNQPGVYYYDYAVPAAYYGTLLAYFSTATSVSQRGLVSLYISVSWLANIDTTISSRLATSGYTAPDNTGIDTLESRLTSTRAGYLDNLTNLDTTISSRAASGSTVTTVSAVSQDGDVTIRRGRDYSGAYALTWTLATPPATTPSAVTLTCAKLSLTKTGTYSNGVISMTFTAAQSAALDLGVYPFEIEGTISGLSVALVDGTITVEADL